MSTHRKTALVFPGQGSQAVGMGKALADGLPAARRVFEEADSVLGMRLSSLCFEGPEEELKLTANTQPAILATSIAALRAFEERGAKADFVAGHSLGEYTALVAARSLKLEDALRVVRKRGLFMQEAVPQGEGAMAALIGGELDNVNALCQEASALGVCAPANINSPGQTVIAGHKSAVEHAVRVAKEKGIRRAVLLAVSAPFHCELMKPAADRLAPVLDEIEFLDLNVPLVTNVDARVISSGDEARAGLIRQVSSPVLWWDSVRLLLGEGVTRFVEVGPGKVLSGLIRQIDRNCEIFNVNSPETFEEAVAACGS